MELTDLLSKCCIDVFFTLLILNASFVFVQSNFENTFYICKTGQKNFEQRSSNVQPNFKYGRVQNIKEVLMNAIFCHFRTSCTLSTYVPDITFRTAISCIIPRFLHGRESMPGFIFKAFMHSKASFLWLETQKKFTNVQILPQMGLATIKQNTTKV